MSWNYFVHEVKHRTRYFFLTRKRAKFGEEGSDEPPALDLLEKIVRSAEGLGLISKVPTGTAVFRVRRSTAGTALKTFEEVGPPPPERATAGRMNPAGISYFYLAFEPGTAVAEVLDKPPESAVLAKFEVKGDMLALDLTNLPAPPSIFDTARSAQRDAILFLDEFVEAITAPIAKDGREHIDYAPSQIVSEYLAQVFTTASGERLSAVIYPSSVMDGGRNVVLFPPRDMLKSFKGLSNLLSVEALETKNWDDHYRLLKKK